MLAGLPDGGGGQKPGCLRGTSTEERLGRLLGDYCLTIGWGRVGVPGWVPVDLTLDSSDLTRLHGCDAREAGGRERRKAGIFSATGRLWSR